MTKEEKINKIIEVIEKSDLDRTIKDILIRDLKSHGLTDFLKDQIIAYCDEAINVIDKSLQKDKTA